MLAGKHAYSYLNALNSAMQAYLTRQRKAFPRGKNAFVMIATTQSFATGGWGPDEMLSCTRSGDLYASLNKTHKSFETPCGSYAHFKLTRYLLRVTRDCRYGDTMEHVLYNTVLGAKPLEPNGHAFYYSDYNFAAARLIAEHRWPCCSGTLPQVAADYRINAYFRDGDGIYVNLYIPSAVSWNMDGAQLRLTQAGAYPLEPSVQFELQMSRPAELALHLRIPAWAEAASLSINGKRQRLQLAPGTFASVRRLWKSGDRVELELPMRMRLAAVDPQHPDTVALLYGPLVLFAIGGASGITRKQLLTAQRVGPQKWRLETANGPVAMLPFVAIKDEEYSTYLSLQSC